jgi:tetratricopeptide (TPR) repeat protein
MRRTFVCLGDAVNLSARFMTAAPAGRIYVSDRVREMAGEAFLWERLGELTVKGKQGAIGAHELTGSLERASRRRIRYELALVGRRAELATLEAGLETAVGGKGGIVGIAAEAGMGKSRLVAEFVRAARRRGVVVAFGECQSFGTNTSYFVWREIWRRLLRVEETDDEADQVRQVEAEVAAIDPTLVARTPLLASVIGLDLPDNALTGALEAKLRKASLENLLATCLRARAANEPLVLVLEDCHWIDALSRDLLEVLGRAAAGLPVLIVLNYRPAAEVGGGLGIARLPSFSEITLAELDRDDAADLIRFKLEQVRAGSGAVASDAGDALVALVTDRSGGNPFYIEELISYIAAHGVDPADPVALRALELPESLHSLVLSRIDTVGEGPRRTLKVASVVGRVFEAPVLPGAYPELGDLDAVIGHLGTLRAADLVNLDRAADQAYLFKHVATQEVAYESLPFAVRSMLHGRVGTYLERSDPDAIERMLDLLAHHFWNSDDDDRKRLYLGKAAEAARASYANATAIDYLTRLVPLLDGAERANTMLKLAKIHELVGDWGQAERVADEALVLATAMGDRGTQGWSHAALAEIARKQGRFDDATSRLDAARAAFEEIGADDGTGQVLHLAGTLAAQRGDYDAAQARYEESLVIRERLEDRASMGGLYSNLGVIAEYRGDYASARAFNERALAIRTEVGDRWAIGVSQNNLGMIALHEGEFDEAGRRFEESMRLNREVGDAWMVAIGHNNLGTATRGLGDHDAARDHYAASLRAYRDYDDRWALAFLLEDISVLAAQTGQAERAFELLGAAESLRATIGSPRGSALEDELAAHLAAARATIGDEPADAAIARGRRLDLDGAVELGLAAGH